MHEYVTCSWYEVNYDNAEQLRYGQNLGCSFSEENCLTYGYVNLMHIIQIMCIDVFMHVAAIIICMDEYHYGSIHTYRHVKFTCMHRNLIPSSFHVD